MQQVTPRAVYLIYQTNMHFPLFIFSEVERRSLQKTYYAMNLILMDFNNTTQTYMQWTLY